MGSFTEKMEALAKDVCASKKARFSSIDGMKDSTARMRRSFREDQRKMRETLGQSLGGFINRIQTDVSQFLHDAQSSRKETNVNTQKKIAETLAALRSRVKTVAQDTFQFLANCDKSLGEMAHRLNQTLSGAKKDRLDKVGALLTGFNATRRQIADDLRSAGKAWGRMLARFSA